MSVFFLVPLQDPVPFCCIVTLVTLQYGISFIRASFLVCIEPVNWLKLRAVVAPSHPVCLQMYFNFSIVLMFKVTDVTLVLAPGGFDGNADERL